MLIVFCGKKFREERDKLAEQLSGILAQKEATIGELQKQVEMLSCRSPRKQVNSNITSSLTNPSQVTHAYKY